MSSFTRHFQPSTTQSAASINMSGMISTSGAARPQWWVRHFRSEWACHDRQFVFGSQVDGITEKSVTYGQLRDRCRALAIRMQSIFQLKHRDTIAVCLPNSIEFPIVCLAGNEAGMTVTTVNPIYTAGNGWNLMRNYKTWLGMAEASIKNGLRWALSQRFLISGSSSFNYFVEAVAFNFVSFTR